MKKDRQAAFDEDDDFCLAKCLLRMSNEEIERLAEQEAESEVSSSAYEGIPLDKAAMKAGLLASYQKLRAERQTSRR